MNADCPECSDVTGRTRRLVNLGSVVFFAAIIVGTVGCKSPVVTNPRPATWATPASPDGPGNFYKVSDSVYRSEQPNAREMAALEKLGIRTIVNYRNVRNDKGEARRTGLTLVHLPINTWKMSYDDLVASVRAITTATKPVLIHCIHGSDRTGAAIAGYRIVVEGWEKQDAIAEFRYGGYGFHEGWFPKILLLLENLDVEQFKKDVTGTDARYAHKQSHP